MRDRTALTYHFAQIVFLSTHANADTRPYLLQLAIERELADGVDRADIAAALATLRAATIVSERAMAEEIAALLAALVGYGPPAGVA